MQQKEMILGKFINRISRNPHMGMLILVRHGECTGNRDDWYVGTIDDPLTPLGRKQARAAARSLRKLHLSRAYTSTLQRAQVTLQIILHQLHQKPPIIRSVQLRERYSNKLQGLSYKEGEKRFGKAGIAAWRRGQTSKTGGESVSQVRARVTRYFMKEIRPHLLKGETVIVVSHLWVLRGLLAHLGRKVSKVPHATPIIIRYP
jgi:2,3-bisphosphoglycerate-dependent phosphoglycerate mutase